MDGLKRPKTLAEHQASWRARLRAARPERLANALGKIAHGLAAGLARVAQLEESLLTVARSHRALIVRVDAIERAHAEEEDAPSVIASGPDGCVIVDGVPHLVDCLRVAARTPFSQRCTCGSVGPREDAAAGERPN